MKYKQLFVDHVRFYKDGSIGIIYINRDGKILGAKYNNETKEHQFQMEAMLKDMESAGFEFDDKEESSEEEKRNYE